ncbi:MAG: hypothetical protein FWH27_01540 [Planctomycetaceae bacterium]|nr:hypothetical protein [Planctomycetaceae bacterium]
MSTGNISYTFAAAAAGMSLSEKQGDSADKLAQSAKTFERTRESVERAEKAAESGAVRDDSAEAGDRDADGRSPWQQTLKNKRHPTKRQEQSKDATGQVGKSLDITG